MQFRMKLGILHCQFSRVSRTLTTKKLVNNMILNLFKTAEHLFSNKISPLRICV